jgi:hypothetical protein
VRHKATDVPECIGSPRRLPGRIPGAREAGFVFAQKISCVQEHALLTSFPQQQGTTDERFA